MGQQSAREGKSIVTTYSDFMNLRLAKDKRVTGYSILSSNAVLVSTRPVIDTVAPFKRGKNSF